MRDLDPSMPDQKILELAVAEGQIVVTMDEDFGKLVYRSGRAHAGVLLLRLEAATGDEKIEVLTSIVNMYSNEILGRFTVFQNGKLRIKR